MVFLHKHFDNLLTTKNAVTPRNGIFDESKNNIPHYPVSILLHHLLIS